MPAQFDENIESEIVSPLDNLSAISTVRITDRRRKRALAAYPASKQPGAPKLKRVAAVRVHPMVGTCRPTHHNFQL
jgi:hypothetical protein